MWKTFEITDGTRENTVDFLSGAIRVLSLQRVIAAQKGIFKSSPLSSGRRLVQREWENSFYNLSIVIKSGYENTLAQEISKLRKLLIKAEDYDLLQWNDTLCYLRIRGQHDSEYRYINIISWQNADAINEFAQPFLTDSYIKSSGGLNLQLECTPFIRLTGADDGRVVKCGWEQNYAYTYPSAYRDIGNCERDGTYDPLATNGVYVTNKSQMSNITDIWLYNQNDPGVWNGNYQDSVIEYPLQFTVAGAPPLINDAVYFGIDDTVDDAHPFTSLAFNINVPSFDLAGVWEYYDNTAAWVALIAADNTGAASAFTLTGRNTVHWHVPTTPTAVGNPIWLKCNLFTLFGGAAPNVNGYWLRYRLTAVGGAPVSATQHVDQRVYTITKPYVDIQTEDGNDDEQIKGDVPALLRIRNRCIGCTDFATKNLWPDRIMVALRSYDRGSEFSPYINMYGPDGDSNPSGISIVSPAPVVPTLDSSMPAGGVLSTPSTGIVYVQFTPAISRDYFGEYLVMMRAVQSSVTGSYMGVQLEVSNSLATYPNWNYATDTIYMTTTAQIETLNFGRMKIPPSSVLKEGDDLTELAIKISFTDGGGAGTNTIRLIDLILIPVDEWICNAEQVVVPSRVSTVPDTDNYVTLDSVHKPKMKSRAIVEELAGSIVGVFDMSSPGPLWLRPDKRQRLFFFMSQATSNALPRISYPALDVEVHLDVAERYFNLIGDD